MFSNFLAGNKVTYLNEPVSLKEWRTDLFVQATAGTEAVDAYVDARVFGAAQLSAFIASFGRVFTGRPDALMAAAQAFETTPSYIAAYTDAVNLIKFNAEREEKRQAAEQAIIDADFAARKGNDLSEDAARAEYEFMQEQRAAEPVRRAKHNAMIDAYVNETGMHFTK